MLISLLQIFGLLIFGFSWLSNDHYRPWVSFHAETLALVGLALLTSAQLASSRAKLLSAPPVMWVWLLPFLPLAQNALGVGLFVGDAVVASLYLAGFAAAIALGYSVSRANSSAEGRYPRIFDVLAIAAGISAVIALLQWLSISSPFGMYMHQGEPGDRSMGNLAQPNQLATLLLIGMASVVVAYEYGRFGRTGLSSLIGLLSIALALTQSRSGMLSVFVIAAFLLWNKNRVNLRITSLFVVIWTVFYACVLAALPFINQYLLISGVRSLNPSTDNARILIWKQVWEGIKSSPWTGYGWNETPTAHAVGSIKFPGELSYTHAHNIFLDLFAWNGLPIGLILTGLIFFWLVSRIARVNTAIGVLALCALIPVGVHSLVEYPFAYAYFLITAGIMVGIVEAHYPSTLMINFNKQVGWLAAFLVMVLGSSVVYEYVKVEEDFRVVRFENLRVGQTPQEYVVPDIWLLNQMKAMLTAARVKPSREMSAEQLDNLRKASLRFPYGTLAVRNALALGLNGDPQGATHQMAVIRGMYGARYYRAAIAALREQQLLYPELALVLTP